MIYLVFDGGNGGHNSNKGYGSFKLYAGKGGEQLEHIDRYEFTDQPMTNNEAEYNTLIIALEFVRDYYYCERDLIIEGDSELVRSQVLGLWKVKKPHLEALRDRVQGLLKGYTYTYNHIPRRTVVEHLGH